MSLYLQSETLWFLRPLDLSLASPKEVELPSSFTFASDQIFLPPSRLGRGSGYFESCEYPVLVSKPHILLEALMLLYARDWDKRIGGFSMAMIGYIELYVDNDGFLDLEQLSEPFSTFYKELRVVAKPLLQWTEEFVRTVGTPENSNWEAKTTL